MEMMVKEEDNKFPEGMKVLAVDDNSTCLIILEAMLRNCHYNVTTSKEATTALQILLDKKNDFHLVICEVHLPHMDGFMLLEQVRLQTDIPVVLMSSDDDQERVMKGISNGASDYLIKPIRIEELKNIWQHVVRKKLGKIKSCQSESVEMSNVGTDSVDPNRDPINNDNNNNMKRKTESKEEYINEEKWQQYSDESKQKKPRVVWLPELHRKFVAAVDQLGVDKAVPKRILELMNVEGITRENVASHLQKYRAHLKRSSDEASPQGNNTTAFGSSTYHDNTQIIRGGSMSYPGTLMSPPTSAHQWSHSDNILISTVNNRDDPINNSIHYSSMMMDHTMNQRNEQSSALDGGMKMPTPTPTPMFDASAHHNVVVDDFSINCNFADNNIKLEVDEQFSNAAMLEASGSRSSADQVDSLTRSKLPKFDSYNNNIYKWPSAGIQYQSFCHDQGLSPSTNIYLPTSTTSTHSVVHNMDYNSIPIQNIIRREFPKNSTMNTESVRVSDPDDAQTYSSGQEALEEASSERQGYGKSNELG